MAETGVAKIEFQGKAEFTTPAGDTHGGFLAPTAEAETFVESRVQRRTLASKPGCQTRPHSPPAHMKAFRTLVVTALAICFRSAFGLGAPNVVPIGDALTTSGQPTASSLAALGAEGFQAVVYLAPNTVQDAVPEEPELLRRQGIEFVHIPIPFEAPSEAHLRAAFSALDRLRDKKTLVHCQVNFRASTVTFLYRVLRLHEDPAQAYEAVARVWVPQGPWRKLVADQLSKHGIKFEPF